MTSYQFTLIVAGPELQDDANADALFKAACDDATVGRVGAVQYLDFDREAGSLADAVFEATEAIESAVPKTRVIRQLRAKTTSSVISPASACCNACR